MKLEQIIIELESCLSKVLEVSESEDYQLAVKKGHANLETNLEKIKHYLEDTLAKLFELVNLED